MLIECDENLQSLTCNKKIYNMYVKLYFVDVAYAGIN